MKSVCTYLCLLMLTMLCHAGDCVLDLGLKNDRLTTETSTASTGNYSYACMLTDLAAQMALYAHKAEVMSVKMVPMAISTTEENAHGKSMYESLKKKHTFIESGKNWKH